MTQRVSERGSLQGNLQLHLTRKVTVTLKLPLSLTRCNGHRVNTLAKKSHRVDTLGKKGECADTLGKIMYTPCFVNTVV